MSYRNATDAQLEFRKAAKKFAADYLPRITRFRDAYSVNPLGKPAADVQAALEAHGRNYLIDSLLSSLNWNITSESGAYLAQLVPESPFASTKDEVTRFIDYLGFDRETEQPLLVVEAKRPGSPLPARQDPPPPDKSAKAANPTPEMVIREIVLGGLRGEKLLYDWNKWLATLKDYVKSVREKAGTAPKRAVLTDGLWCILFLDPELLFEKPGDATTDHLRVYLAAGISESFVGEIDSRFPELFGYLDYNTLASGTPPLRPVQLPFHFPANQPMDALRGLRIKYGEHERFFAVEPSIEVSPIIFVRAPGSPWFQVRSSEGQYLPPKEEDVPEHLAEVAGIAGQLEADLLHAFPCALSWRTLQQHFADEPGFRQVPGFREYAHDEYLVVTGTETHYIRGNPSVPDCPFHNWDSALAADRQWPNQAAVSQPTVDPRVKYPSPSRYHCAHRDINLIKSQQVTPENRARCGTRSAKDAQAFCEIRMFEQHLCCRTCVFENVCESAEVFTPPCHRPAAAAPAAPAQ
jgi:hypothetical protein